MRKNSFSIQVFLRRTVLGMAAIPLIFLTSCRDDDSTTTTSGTGTTTSGISITSTSTTSSATVGLTATGADTTDNIANNSFANTITITFSGTTATVSGTVSGVSASVSNGTVNITSTASGVNYVVSGTTTNGALNIASDNQFKLTLNGANITNASGPAINITSAVKAFVDVPSGTTNTLTDTASSAAALYSAGSLLFSGSGTLSVAGNVADAIQVAAKVRVTDTTLNITAAVNDGIQAGTLFVMDSGTLNITTTPTTSYSKGVSVLTGYLIVNDGTINITTSGSAGMSNQYVSDSQSNTTAYSTIINGGTINITASSSSAETEGIESNHGTVNINGGTLTLNVTDDAINGESSVNINGGKTYAYVTGNDAVDSNGTMYITGGILVAVSTAASPETSLDSDRNTFNISGGIVVGITPGATPTSPSASTQPVVLLGSGSANQIINLQDSNSKEVITFLAPAAYSNILISTPNLSKSTTYSVYKGGSVSNGESFNGLYTSGTYSGGTLSKTFTTGSSSYTQSTN